ncbi:MAG: cardiolipin synthase [Phycisphaeraceae bacterium]
MKTLTGGGSLTLWLGVISWSLLYLISEWLLRIVMTLVVVRRKKPTPAMAWLLIIFFQPWFGLFLYMLMGEYRLPRRRIQQHQQAQLALEDYARLAVQQPHIVRPVIEPEHRTLISMAEHMGEMPIVGGNGVELLADTEAFIEKLIADIDAAEQHVHLMFYIYGEDETSRRVSAALMRAAERGVRCRLLADAVGARPMFRSLASKMTEAGVEVRPAMPVTPFRRKLARIDLRNHRKIVVIDGRVGYTGSQNIIDPSYGTRHLRWVEMMVRLTGPAVAQLQGVFVEDWYFDTDEALTSPDIYAPPIATGDVPIQSLPSGPTYPTENYQRLVVAAIHAARERVIITTPYLVPDEALLTALHVATMRGVRVDLIVPDRSDQPVTAAAGRSYYEDLLEAGVNIYQYTHGLLHAKTMSVDDAFALIGSSNFDIRSFYLNFELNLLLYGPKITSELRYRQSQYIADSTRLSLEDWQQRPYLQRTAEDLAKLLSPLL